MADRYDKERRRRDWDREERMRYERRGPQGFNREDWDRSRKANYPVQNPLEDRDDYRMHYREAREEEGDWNAEHDRWMDYGRDYAPRSEGWQADPGRFRRESPWQGRDDERDFEYWDEERPDRPWRSRGRTGQDWNDYEMDYGRGVYNQRRGRYERERGWDEGRSYRGRDYDRYGRQQERGFGDIRGRGYGWEGGYMDPYNRGFFRREEQAYPDYMERYDERRSGDEWDADEDYEGDVTYSYSEFWLTPGPFTGVGPKGYQRSDDRIFEDVCFHMSMNGQLDPSEIDVRVDNGEVTLEGNVQDRFSKRLAEDIAESVSGVHDVHNRIRVGERESQQRLSSQEGAQGQTSERGENMEE